MSNRRLGRLGEKFFSMWASQINLTCEDETGWDFIVEWPIETGGRLLDKVQPVTCRGNHSGGA